MAFDREAAKKAGYSDEEIDAYLAQQQPVAPSGPQMQEPTPDQVLGGKVVTNDRPGSFSEVAIPVATELLPSGGDIAKYGAAAYGLYKGGQLANKYAQGIDAAKALAEAQKLQAEAAMASEKGIQSRFDIRRGAPMVETPTTGQPYNVKYNIPPQGMPSTTPPASAPSMAPQTGQAVQAENWMNRAMQMAKQAAPTLEKYAATAGRVLEPAARMASRLNPYITLAEGLTYSGNLGPKVPTTGPLRGSEINPATRRGWTDQELQEYARQYGR